MSRFTQIFYALWLPVFILSLAGCATVQKTTQPAVEEKVMLEVWHADSLAGPMMEMKKAFEAKIST